MGRSTETVEQIRAANDIVSVVGSYVRLRKAGRNYKGLCPFHREKTPSFIVSPERETFHCFGCGKGGDVYRFIMEMDACEFPEAMRTLATRAGIKLPSKWNRDQGINEGPRQALAFAETHFYKLLQSDAGKGARQYLSERGITGESIETFRIGFAPEAWRSLKDAANRGGIVDAKLIEAGLIIDKENGTSYDRFRSRIQFPIQDPSGRIIGFGGRVFGEGEPKYLNSPETGLFKKSDSLYGVHQARRDLRNEGTAILVEGYTDVISLYQSGIRNVVAPLGTALTPGHVRLLRNYADRIVLLFDGDEAGMRATLRSLEVVMAGGLTPLVASLPAGQDPDDLLRAEGVEAIRTRITSAASIVPFVLEHPFPGGREEALRTLVRLLAASRDEIRLSLFVQEAARKSGIREEIFHKEIDRAKGRETKDRVAKVVHAPKIRRRLIDAQRGIAYLGLENPTLIPVIQRVVKPDEVHDVPARKLLKALFECHDRGEQPTSSLLTLQGVDEAFSQIGVENEEIEDPLHILQDYIACIHEEEIDVAVKSLNEQIRDAEERNDAEALLELLKKRTQVSAKKKKIAYAYRVHSRTEKSASGERSESTL